MTVIDKLNHRPTGCEACGHPHDVRTVSVIGINRPVHWCYACRADRLGDWSFVLILSDADLREQSVALIKPPEQLCQTSTSISLERQPILTRHP